MLAGWSSAPGTRERLKLRLKDASNYVAVAGDPRVALFTLRAATPPAPFPPSLLWASHKEGRVGRVDTDRRH